MMNRQQLATLANSLPFNQVWKNPKNPFTDCPERFVAIGATVKPVGGRAKEFGDFFSYRGKYRMFDTDNAGPSVGTNGVPVSNAIEARHLTLQEAVVEHLVNPYEHLLNDENGALPWTLHVISGDAGFLTELETLLAEGEDAISYRTEKTLQYLSMMAVVRVCEVSKETMGQILA